MIWKIGDMEKVFLSSVYGDDSKMLGEIEKTLEKYKSAKSTTGRGEVERLNRVAILEALKNKYDLL